MSKIKKPIEIIRHPIEMHGKICSTARTKDDGATTVEWVRQTKQKDGYWTKSKITFTQLLIFELSHIPLTDADRWREGITSEDWVAKEIRKDKKPSHIDCIDRTTPEDRDKRAIKQEQWKNQYRLEHPIYNLNHGGPSFVAGIVSAFLGSLLIAVFSMNQSFVSRYALVCFAVGYGVDWLAKKEFHKAFEKQFSMWEKK